jgi:DNA-binding NarL/FixJ family response regulator
VYGRVILEAARHLQPVPAPPAAPEIRPLRVLVVDSDPIACAGWQAVLQAQSWIGRCEAIMGPDDIAHHALMLAPDVALVGLVLDNGHHGIDVCRQLRLECPGVRVIIVCDADSVPVRAVRAAGASGLMHRTWPVETQVAVVRRVAEGEAVLAGSPVKAAGLARLSRRELSVLRMLANGASNPEIAAALHLSQHTVKEYTQTVFRKLGVRNRVEAAMAAARLGYAD